METIKPLSEAVQSIVRSGFIISCLTTVVEELIYNSLDAGATKVSVSVAVNNGYIKVEDDGSGISRDGLVLLGERYATSKLRHFHEKDDFVGSFGFRGEVLCSIADISLVEVVTRVQGRPNGYRKVMKGRKCLCLSIDDDRQNVGTTVIVRDLFYNQPVRRRQMQHSVKKVLHSVKKSALRIALVLPNISFKVIDMESEDELLCTRSSPSPLSLMCSNFGIEAASLYKMSFSEGPLKLTGYVSSLSSSFSSKVIQYIYVNSRFVVKGPIHKLLNHLADMCHDQLGGDRGGKRGQPQGPLYCLNLICPLHSYDLNLEFSRASVEFKDWVPVLAFVEKSVTPMWSKEVKRGISHNLEADHIRKDDIKKVVEKTSCEEKDWWLKTCENSTKRRRIQNTEDQHACTEDSLGMPVEDCGNLSVWKNNCRQRTNPERITAKFGESDTEKEFLHRTDFTGHSNSIFNVRDGIGIDLLDPDNGLANRDLLRNDISTMDKEANYANNCLSSSRWQDEASVETPFVRNHKIGSVGSFEYMPENDRNRANDDQREFLLRSYSWENSLHTPLDCDKEYQFQTDNFKANRNCNNSYENEDADSLSRNFHIHQRAQCQSEVTNLWPLPQSYIGCRTRKGLDLDHMECDYSLPSCVRSFDREYHLESPSKPGASLFPCSPENFCLQSATTYPFLKVKGWDFDNFIQNEGFERKPGVRNSDAFEQSNYEKDEFYSAGLGNRCSNTNFTSTSCLNSTSLFTNEYTEVEKASWEFSPHGHNNVDKMSSVNFGVPLFEDIYSPSPDRRRRDSSVCWSPFLPSNKGIQMDLQRFQEFGQDSIPTERSGRSYDSPDGLLIARHDSTVTNETISPCLDFQRKLSSYKPSPCFSSGTDGKRPKLDHPRCEVYEQNHSSLESGSSVRPRRSHSAPPFFRGRKRFLSVKSSLISPTENSDLRTAPQVCTVSENAKSKNPLIPAPSSSISSQHEEMRFGEDSLFFVEQKGDDTSNITQATSAWSLDGKTEAACFSIGYLKDFQDSETSETKWREGCPDTRFKEIANCLRAGDRLNDLKAENEILDIHSCMLDIAGDSLVPKSINRNGLQKAKVLVQIDNKYIPIVANGTLAVIDQHAADERIRLEEMRHKVLSGELKSINYLDKEKDLVLPEMAYQLLCNYADHIKHWGWICNIFSQDSGSFAKNLSFLNERASALTLIAVPCILGVNLSDTDLVEYLEQLADTDGSSTIPPSVVRVLNNKACRGAIMFGDKLMPSECSLIVEELKRTSLCFQCAHGRPTTVPLVNLKVLQKGVLQLGSWHERSKNTWHGLCRKEITLDRAKRRLNMVKGCE
ncbi:hypothetical protein SOVF_016200 [Spinacia oleracea]|uniref:DNA mismatch repair protein MLH3 isoform X2 n=1 Tax=Spinacia oleracea TaxID=3562 RepID=A0A9R0JHM4_SPIOL|nr:DNA mismatch repair protein MLH3 isoform X2 [Spinacia oleracea]KNA24368.1 hypothetical protein SOVF_016200 [Spinacia oleracea]